MSIHIKNEKEIAAMRVGGKILGEILAALEKMVAPGVTPLMLEAEAERLFKSYGVKSGCKGYHGYPNILCVSVNEQVVHAIPTDIPLKEGDVLSIDCVSIYDDLNTDSAVAVGVGTLAPISDRLIKTCIQAMWAGIDQVKPGNRIGDISHAIEQVVKNGGFKVVKELTGHGIGYTMHEDPYVPNQGSRGQGALLRPGMTIAIEPIISIGSPKIRELKDHWTLVTIDDSWSMQHEHTVLVTDTGFEVLTLRPNEL